MYDAIIIYGRAKTGKTRLGRLIARLTGAVLADDCHDPIGILAAHKAFPVGPIVITVMEAKSGSDYLTSPAGTSLVVAAADLVIRMPNLSITKDRGCPSG